jgi:hypothetical protein
MALDEAQIAGVTELIGLMDTHITAIVLARDDLTSLLRTHADALDDASSVRLSAAKARALSGAQALAQVLR